MHGFLCADWCVWALHRPGISICTRPGTDKIAPCVRCLLSIEALRRATPCKVRQLNCHRPVAHIGAVHANRRNEAAGEDVQVLAHAWVDGFAEDHLPWLRPWP